MTFPSKPSREPLRSVVSRTFSIAIVAGAVVAFTTGRLSRGLLVALMALWPSYGGHWIEILFLHWLRPKLPQSRAIQALARLSLWFTAGIAFTFAMRATASILASWSPALWPWWVGGLAFLALELILHAILHILGRPSFYNGRG